MTDGATGGPGGWTQPTAAATGFAPYGLIDRRQPRGRLPHKRPARRFGNPRKDSTMSDTLTKLLDRLKTSTVSIVAHGAPDEQEALLTKSFQEFGDVLATEIQASLDEAYVAGGAGDIEKYLGPAPDGEEDLQKAFGPLADFAMCLSSTENTIKRMCGIPTDSYGGGQVGYGGREPVPAEIQDAMFAWLHLGTGIMRMMLGPAPIDIEAEKSDGTIELVKSEFPAGEELEKLGDQIREAALRFGVDLSKAAPGLDQDPTAIAGGPDQFDLNGDGQMSPLETLGRLLAAGLMVVDQMAHGDAPGMGPDDQPVADPEPLDQAPQEGDPEEEAGEPADEAAREAAAGEVDAQEVPGKKGFGKADDQEGEDAMTKVDDQILTLLKSMDAKLTGQDALIGELSKAVVAQAADLAKIKAQPAPGGPMRTIALSKADDNADLGANGKEADLAKLDPDARGLELAKRALRQPRTDILVG